jgi:wyosine [tRNA(Phe)-imidazoG37] synthetase (radical SAM superfamily)
MHAIGRFEARIEYIARQLKNTWNFLARQGFLRKPPPNSFFLQRLSDWLIRTEVASEELDPYAGVLQYLSWPCGADCEFCLHKNDPPGYWTKSQRWQRSHDEIELRLKHYSPDRGTALFRTQDYAFFEITTHPDFLSTVARLRAKTKAAITFTTNGTMLTEEFVHKLAAFKPLHLMVSLNSANPTSRALTMHETNPLVGIECLKHLQRARISYSVTIVPYNRAHLDELSETMQYAEDCDAYLIRINFPGYSRFFAKPPVNVTEARRFWRNVIHKVGGIHLPLQTPILFQPSHVDFDLAAPPTTDAAISGTIRNSPARRAGLRPGDTIIAVDDAEAKTRTQTIRALRLYRTLRIDRLTIYVRRNGRISKHDVMEQFTDPHNGSDYPYFSHLSEDPAAIDLSFPYGIVLQPTFDPDWLLSARRIIERKRARSVLIICSELLQPLVTRIIRDIQPFKGLDAEVHLTVAANKHFLGGDIAPGDLLVVDDFVSCSQEQKAKVDLVLIPSTPFGLWGRDISNASYLEIERVTNIPVELIPCHLVAAI